MHREAALKTLLIAATCLSAGLVPALLSCSDQSNPFSHPANAEAVVLDVSGGVGDGDTIPMYSTRMVYVGVLVPEQVDSFSVATDTNRYFVDTVVRAPGTGDFAFPVSFLDTGLQTVRVKTFRANGDESVEEIAVYSALIVDQQDVEAEVNQEVEFRTLAGVEDSVYYHWEYGDDISVSRVRLTSRNASFHHTLRTVCHVGGRLWVSLDPAGTQLPSPHDSFTVTVTDGDPPRVENLTVDGDPDEMVTSDNALLFLVLVDDSGGVDTVTIDGVRTRAVSGGIYRKVYGNLSAAPDSVHRIDVRAVDVSGNATTRTFTLRYDSGAPGLPQTTILLDREDTLGTDGDLYPVVGKVFDNSHTELLITATVNGVEVSDTDRVVLSEHEARFGVWVPLQSAVNDVILNARDLVGNELAVALVTILRDSTFADTTGPGFLDVTVGGQTVAEGLKTLVGGAAETLTVATVDPSGVAWLRVGDDTLTSLDSRNYLWRTVLQSIPFDSARSVVVSAADTRGNESTYQFLLQRDLVPQMQAGWKWPDKLWADQSDSVDFNVIDEGDVEVSLVSAPPWMTLQELEEGRHFQVSWSPAAVDTGAYIVRLLLDDGGQDTLVEWPFSVLAQDAPAVELDVTPWPPPAYLQVDVDVLQASLEAVSGAVPFRYVVQDADRGRVLLDTTAMTDSMGVAWTPAALDTGEWHLTFMLVDQPDSVVMTHSMTVVPRNSSPCDLQLSLAPSTDTTAQGDIDMRAATEPVLLTFTIVDADHPFTERYVRTITRSGVTSVDTLQQAGTFSLMVDTSSESAYGSVRVTIADATGTSDTVNVGIVYESGGPAVSDLYPLPTRFIAGVDYHQPFVVVDPDRAVSLSVDSPPTGLSFLDSGAENTWLLDWSPGVGDVGEHEVTMTLDNGQVSTEVVWEFSVIADSSSLVLLDTAGAIPPYLETGHPLVLDLAPVSGTGQAPFRYRASMTGIEGLLLDSTHVDTGWVELRWTAGNADTGLHLLSLSITDGFGDGDTLFCPVLVVRANGDPLTLSVVLPDSVDTTAFGDVDMRTATGPVTAQIVIDDSDHHLTEQYNVRITQKSVTTTQTFDSAYTLTVTLDTVGSGAFEEIVVVVSDRSGGVDTAVVTAVYSAADPRLENWTWPTRFVAGTVYDLPLTVVTYSGSPDISVTNQPGDLSFTQSGPPEQFVMHFGPVAGDIGTYTVEVTVSDGSNDTTHTWAFDVLGSDAHLVHFGTTTGELPSSATVADTMVVDLRVQSGSGKAPFRYVARMAGGGPAVLDSTMADRSTLVFDWIPVAGDEGPRTLVYAVEDGYGDADTLVHNLVVYAENRNPCQLTYQLSPGADTLANGNIWMPARADPVQVAFSIVDADHPATEHYQVTVEDVNGITPLDLGSTKTFSVTIDTAGHAGWDTTIVSVSDSTGTTDTVVLVSVHETAYPGSIGGATSMMQLDGNLSDVWLTVAGPLTLVNKWEDPEAPFGFEENAIGNMPYYDTSGFGGDHPLVDFDRYYRDNLLAGNSRTSWDWVAGGFTVFVVARLETMATDSQYTLLSATANSLSHMALGVSSNQVSVFTEAAEYGAALPVTANTWHVYTFRSPTGQSGTTCDVDLWLNGVRGTSVQATGLGNYPSSMVGACGANVAVHNWDGPMAEVLMYEGALGDGDVRTVQEYLAARYGIVLE